MTLLYQSQRTMRAMRQAALQRGVVAVLDIGTTKIACLILQFDGYDRGGAADGVGSLAGQSDFRVIGAATTRSRGVRLGEIDSMGETERAIRTAVQAAQKMAMVRVDHAAGGFFVHIRGANLIGCPESESTFTGLVTTHLQLGLIATPLTADARLDRDEVDDSRKLLS